MKKMLSTSVATVLILFGLNNSQAQRMFQKGGLFPNLALPSLEDGQPDSIAHYRGQKLILHIFASW